VPGIWESPAVKSEPIKDVRFREAKTPLYRLGYYLISPGYDNRNYATASDTALARFLYTKPATFPIRSIYPKGVEIRDFSCRKLSYSS
jgi:hypothetical protein